jgi:glutathione synthase/RimK-type ligase-like ATP-grasp enzyme
VTTRIALATAAEFPDLDEDAAVLLPALAAAGLDAGPAVWTDDGVDWSAYDLVVVRSTWDYHERHVEFLDWARSVESVTTLANSADVLTWNTTKTYLRTLQQAGLPVVPTDWLDPGDVFVVPEAGEYVVKPAVSAGSRDTNRYLAGDHDDLAVAHVQGLLAAGRTVMVQPYLDQVDMYGETALFFFAGDYSHAVRKGPLLTPAMALVAGAYKPETIEPRQPTEAEREAAEQVLDALATLAPASRDQLVYARVDLVPGPGGDPVLLELELAEPSMFLVEDGTGGTASAKRFAAAIRAATGAEGG